MADADPILTYQAALDSHDRLIDRGGVAARLYRIGATLLDGLDIDGLPDGGGIEAALIETGVMEPDASLDDLRREAAGTFRAKAEMEEAVVARLTARRAIVEMFADVLGHDTAT